jgi:hypothetical protein
MVLGLNSLGHLATRLATSRLARRVGRATCAFFVHSGSARRSQRGGSPGSFSGQSKEDNHECQQNEDRLRHQRTEQ